jgi:4-hydroxybenzoate polyprenyltransferase
MKELLRAYFDLMRLHFFFVWPTLFCAGLFLAFQSYGGFSFVLIIQAAFIGFFGFEAGLILNDIVDADIDKKELPTDNKLTMYWRPFGKRPISQGLISQRKSILLFAICVAVTTILIFALPFPNFIYVFSIMVICYCLEIFYQLKKRKETLPIAQVVGRIDFALFLVAGYLCVGNIDTNMLVLFLFFYPLALAHLGVNDLVDVSNDKAKKMNTIATMYGIKATTYWILVFSLFHFVMASVFIYLLSSTLLFAGFAVSFSLLAVGNILLSKQKSDNAAIKVLPLFHLAMLIYAISIIANYLAA